MRAHGHAGGDSLLALAHDRLGQHGGGGSAVARLVVLLVRHLAQHLRAHILDLVGKLDFLGDGDAVLGDPGSAEALVDDDVSALGTNVTFTAFASVSTPKPRKTSSNSRFISRWSESYG